MAPFLEKLCSRRAVVWKCHFRLAGPIRTARQGFSGQLAASQRGMGWAAAATWGAQSSYLQPRCSQSKGGRYQLPS